MSDQPRSHRSFPWISASAFAVGVALFAGSFVQYTVRITNGTFAEPGMWVRTDGGRVISSRQNMVSSYISMPAAPSWKNAGGFSFERRMFGSAGLVGGKLMAEHLAVPTYPLPLLAGVPFAWRLRRWIRQPVGHCARCGYDLRATETGGRCPECGTVKTA